MNSKDLHYANVGFLMLNHALPESQAILARLGHAELGKVPTDAVALPYGGNGGAIATVVLPGGGQALSGLQSIEALIGTVMSRGREKVFKLAKMYHDGTLAFPTVDCFGRPFPTVQEILAMPKTKAQRLFTNSGWCKVMTGSTGWYQSGEAGESFLGSEIKAGDWRGWNGRVGSEARYIRPDEFVKFYAQTGVSAEGIKAMIETNKLTVPGTVVIPPVGTEPVKRTARKRETAK